MTEYVAGFLFSPDLESVVLIRKNKPEWQKGLLNGIGGKIEPGEATWEAMRREFKEEAGLDIEKWIKFCEVGVEGDYKVYFFYATSPNYEDVMSMTDEKVQVIDSALKPHTKVIKNLFWLIPLAIDKALDYSGKIVVH